MNKQSLKVFLEWIRKEKYLEIVVGLDGHKDKVIKSFRKNNISIGLDVNNKPQYVRLTNAYELDSCFQVVGDALDKKRGPTFEQIEALIEKCSDLVAETVPGMKKPSLHETPNISLSYNIRGKS